MANTNDKPPAPQVHTQALDEHGLILINLDASALAIFDALSERLGQLQAMLAITYGESDNPFYSLSDQHLDRYHFALARQVDVIEQLVDLLAERRE